MWKVFMLCLIAASTYVLHAAEQANVEHQILRRSLFGNSRKIRNLGSSSSSGMIRSPSRRFVDKKSFNIVTGLRQNCFTDIDQCQSGLLITFYLKVENWDGAAHPSILRTTNEERTYPGIYVGVEGADILVFLRGSSGKTIMQSFSRDDVYQRRSKIDIWYGGSLFVFVNGTTVKNTAVTAQDSVSERDPGATANFTAGSDNGLTFYLDGVSASYPAEIPESYSPTTLSSTEGAVVTTVAMTTKTTTTKSTTIKTDALTKFTTATTDARTTTAASKTKSIFSGTSRDAGTRTESEFTTYTIGPKPTGDISNIWIPIAIALLALIILVGCLIRLMCLRKRRKEDDQNLNRDGVPLAEIKGDYHRVSTIAPYHDGRESNQDTDGNQTDNEGQGNRLLGGK